MIKHLKTLEGHQNPIYALSNFNNKAVFFSAGNDKGVVEWSLDTLAFSKVLMPISSSSYVILNAENRLYVGMRNGLISVFDVSDNKSLYMLSKHHKAVFDIKFLSYKKEIISVGEDGLVNIWSYESGTHLYQFEASKTTIRTIAISNDEKELAIGTKDGVIKIFDTSDFSLKKEFQAHDRPVTSLIFHPNNMHLLSGGRDAQLKVWNVSDLYSLEKQVAAHMFSIYAITFHPVLNYVATASQDKSIKIWDATNYRLLKILSLEKLGFGHTHSINNMIWSHDGKFLISTGDDKIINIWTFEN